MIIQHNIMSLNAHRQLGGNTNLVSKNLEKLSSGFKINRAGDDAAGLAISEKMRAQITGLTRAQANAQDGISLVQTAEGALTEVHSMLNRMVDLATQSSNGTMQSDDRQKIQDEMNALTGEIDRISKSTNFNGINLLDGSLGGGASVAKTAAVTAAAGTYGHSGLTFSGGKDGVIVAFGAAVAAGGATANTSSWNGNTLTIIGEQSKTYSQDELQKIIDKASGTKAVEALKVQIGDGTGKLAVGATAAAVTAAATFAGFVAASVTVNGVTLSSQGGLLANGGAITISDAAAGAAAGAAWTNNALALTLDRTKSTYTAAELNAIMDKATGTKHAAADGLRFDFEGSMTRGALAATYTLANGSGAKGGGLELQIGDTADSFNKVNVSVDNMGAAGLGIAGIAVGDQGVASSSIATIKSAINKVSTNRSAMGALQNRLEHTINNLGVATENMTAAESRVRDVDMAKEMMTFTKNNVLTQAAQAMLAQANQQPQQVLQLLR